MHVEPTSALSRAPSPSPLPLSSYDIPGNDIPAPDGKTPYTKWCSPKTGGYKGKYGWAAAQLVCDDTPGCLAIVWSMGEDCGYLKAKGTRDVVKPNDGFFVMTSQERVQKPCSFFDSGGPCTTDPWVEQPLCCNGVAGRCVNGRCA